MEDAIRGLSVKISAHLAPNEIAHVTGRNISSLNQADAAKAQAAVERALRRRVRNPAQVEMALTLSENSKGFLLVAEIRRDNARIVEMAEFRVDAAPPAPRAKFTIAKKILWEQERPILDLALIEDQLLVLDTDGLTRFERRDDGWSRVESAAIPVNVRDPRGRLTLSDSLVASLPGSTCRGTIKPLALTCEHGSDFTAARNTIESADWPASFSHSQIGEDHFLAELDGRVHVYDGTHKPIAVFDEWGADFAAIPSGCAANRLLAASPSERDSVALYEMLNHAPARVSDPAEFPGPVTALWPSPMGAMAVARNLSTGRYEAYSLSVDCGR
jgi:hypothetical protein